MRTPAADEHAGHRGCAATTQRCAFSVDKGEGERERWKTRLVGSDDELGDEFVGERVEVVAVEDGLRAGTEVFFYIVLAIDLCRTTVRRLTMLEDMTFDFIHCVADSRIRVQEHVVLSVVPFAEGRKLC